MFTNYKCIPNESDIKTNPLLSISGDLLAIILFLDCLTVQPGKLKTFKAIKVIGLLI